MKERLETERMKLEREHLEHNRARSELFDASKNIRLVPKFCEKTVDKYFPQFEKIAGNLKWPKSFWSTMLQSVFVGKAAEVYSSLSSPQSADYEIVKTEVLKAYELVPEAYRQKFRSFKKYDSQTYVEFAREKEDLFDKWLNSKKVVKNFDKLRQLMLLEEFKQCVHQDLKTHLDDKNIETLQDAAFASDNYSLSHKRNFKGPNTSSIKSPGFKINDSKSDTQNKNQTSSPVSSSSPSQSSSFDKKQLTCGYCKKKGHIVSECFKLQRKNEREGKSQPSGCAAPLDTSNLASSQPQVSMPSPIDAKVNDDPKPSGCTSPCVSSKVACPEGQVLKSSSRNFMEDYKPFISDGFISLVGNDTTLQPIKILRDTGASQTLLLEGVLPLSDETSVGASILLKGVELGCVNVPLHHVYLKSDLITGPVVVGVRPNLPIAGISLLLGNDLARNKVVAEPIVLNVPEVHSSTYDEDSDLFPSCVLTRAMHQTQQKDTDELATE